jgi:hypothetical protein
MYTSNQSLALLRQLIIESILNTTITSELERLKSLGVIKDFGGSDSDSKKLDSWIEKITKSGDEETKEASAAGAFINMFSKKSFERALQMIEDAIGVEALYSPDTTGKTLEDISQWSSLSEAFGGISMPNLSPKRNKQRGPRSFGNSKPVAAGDSKKPKLSAEKLKDLLVLHFTPTEDDLDGFFGFGGNKKFLSNLANSAAEKIMSFSVNDLKQTLTKYVPSLGAQFQKKEAQGSLSGFDGLDDTDMNDEPKPSSVPLLKSRSEKTKPEGSKSGKRELFPAEQRIASEFGFSVKSGKQKAMRDVIDWLIANRKLDASALQEALRRGRTKIIINENTRRVRIVNY